MTILVYDSAGKDGKRLSESLKKICPDDKVSFFCREKELLEFAGEHLYQTVFMFLNDEPVKELELSDKLMHIIPRVNLIIAAKDEKFCLRALKLHASGYIILPADEDRIREELENLLYPAPLELPVISADEKTSEISIDGKQLCFSYRLTAKLFILLLKADGAMVSTASIIDMLWEEKTPEKSRSYLQNLRSDLKKTLAGAGLEDLLMHRRGKMWLDRDRFRLEFRRN